MDGGWRLVAPGDCDLELGEGRGWVCVGGEGGPVCVCLSVFVHFGTLNPSSSELASPLRHGGESWWRQFLGERTEMVPELHVCPESSNFVVALWRLVSCA